MMLLVEIFVIVATLIIIVASFYELHERHLLVDGKFRRSLDNDVYWAAKHETEKAMRSLRHELETYVVGIVEQEIEQLIPAQFRYMGESKK